MTNEDYIGAQQALTLIGALAQDHDWTAFVNRINQTETVGPLTHPTEYQEAMGILRQMSRIAGKLVDLKEEYAKLQIEVQEVREHEPE